MQGRRRFLEASFPAMTSVMGELTRRHPRSASDALLEHAEDQGDEVAFQSIGLLQRLPDATVQEFVWRMQRRAVVQDDALSMNAKNVKIIADKSGTVTLRGVVDSQSEKDPVESKAKSVAGVRSVNNMIEVKAP